MSTSRAATAPPIVLIRPTRGWISLGYRQIWEYRELLYFLVWRDVKVRYKQTLLGAAWAVLQPLLTMVVFTIFFGKLAGIGSEGVPYPIFSYAGLLPWTFFAQGLTSSAGSVVGSSNLITKVYFPRLVIPIASVLSGVIDLAIAFLFLVGMMVHYGIWPSARLLLLPVMLPIAMGTAIGVGTWLAALNVEYRDVRYVVPFFVQLWLFVTPVIYPASRVTTELARVGVSPWLYGLNPMVGVVEGFRYALLKTGRFPLDLLIAGSVVTMVLVVSGAFYFRRMERNFADII